jgi:phenylalanyl-tRNA synthetase beta chain
MVGADRRRILDRLPYVGLDIESLEGDTVRVEYSPNRPDFGTDIGIARAIRGVLGKEVGAPHFQTKPTRITVSVDRALARVRPFIACATATGVDLDDEDVRQIISLQEDLHNGLGRKRRVVAIGLHDLRAVNPPLRYMAVDSSFKFVPLGGSKERSIDEILRNTAEGRSYGKAIPEGDAYPIISDSTGTVLSFPPIINGNATKVGVGTKGIFVDVTSTERRAGEDVLALIMTTFSELGAEIGSVKIEYPGSALLTPNLSPSELPLDMTLIRSVLGMQLARETIVHCLARSRISVKGKKAVAPRYRIDLLHPVDLAEEVALGYGVDRIDSVYPPSNQAGSFDRFENFLDSTSTVMAESGMIEMMTFELVDAKSLYSNFDRPGDERVTVHDPRSIEHSILRDSLIPTLMSALAGNAGEQYPQLVFEIGRVYTRRGDTVSESWRLTSLIAHSQASFSEAKMYLESMVATVVAKEAVAEPAQHWAFAHGRTASVKVDGVRVGYVGELRPSTIAAFGIKVPVSGFEVDLRSLYELLK